MILENRWIEEDGTICFLRGDKPLPKLFINEMNIGYIFIYEPFGYGHDKRKYIRTKIYT